MWWWRLGLRVCARGCLRGCSRDEVLGDGGAGAYLLPEEMRAVVEAASPM